jgi:predicted acetyltransferase
MSHAAGKVTLEAATAKDLPCIENLMQFYNYDLSQHYPIHLAEHGLYALRPKTAYWAKPEVVPFIVRVDGVVAGFAVVDDAVQCDRSKFNMGYFFIAQAHRGSGVGSYVLRALLTRFIGRWEIYHLAKNTQAARFWSGALSKHVVGPITHSQEIIDNESCVLYQFTTAHTP